MATKPRRSKSKDEAPTEAASIRSGGIDLEAERVIVGGDVVGRDKIVNNIQHIYERALTAAEDAEQEQAIEAKYLAQGVSMYAQRLQARASDTTDAAKGGPYKGLLEYRLSDAEIFFGREKAIRDVLGCLQNSPLTVLQSESGAGKTSLLQAGLSPQLIAAGELPLYLRPYNAEPTYVIKRAFISDPSLTPTLVTAPLRDFLRRVCDVLGSEATLYIFLDQFEEFFTQLGDPARDEFVRELAECLDDESLNVRWLLAVRAEHFGDLANFRPRIRHPFENDYRLNRLTRAEAVQVITEPAARRGIVFEPGLVDALLNDLGRNEIAPPQLQLVCAALFDELAEGETAITRALYEREGGAAGILRGYLEQVLSRNLRREDRAAARWVLESLISSEQQRIIRARAEVVDELSRRGVTPQTLDVILTQLVDSRLLRTEETDTGVAYELAHDYLLQEIKLDPEVQARKAAQELLEQEMRAYRRYQTLLTEDRLKVIEPYRKELSFTPEAEALFTESQKAVQKERAARERRRNALLVTMFAVAVVMALLGAFGLNRSEEAGRQAAAAQAEAVRADTAERVASARLLLAQGQVEFEDEPLLGVRLGLEGLALVPPDDAATRQSIADAVRKLAGQGRLLKLGDDIEKIYPSADGSVVVLDHANTAGEVRRSVDGARVVTLTDKIESVNVSPDMASTYFVVDYVEAPSELRRMADGTLVPLTGKIESVRFSPDPAATYFVVRYSDAAAELRRSADSMLITTLASHPEYLEFSSDPAATYFVLNRRELRRSGDGGLIATLPDNVNVVSFSPDASYLIVYYFGFDNINELRRSADGALVPLSAKLENVYFGIDPAVTSFVVGYADAPGELRRTADAGLVATLRSRVGSVSFLPYSAPSYVAVEYFDGQDQLFQIVDGSPIPLAGQYASVYFSPNAAYFVMDAPEGPPGELHRSGDGQLVAALEDDVDAVYFSQDPAATYFVVDYFSALGELRRAADGTRIAVLSGAIHNVEFSPDPAATYVVVEYNEPQIISGTFTSPPAELRRTVDGAQIPLTGKIASTDVIYSNDITAVDFRSDASALYAVVDYADSRSELWGGHGELHRLTELGLGRQQHMFDLKSQRLIVAYTNGPAYLLDLQWLQAMGGDLESSSSEELARLLCTGPLATGPFDASALESYLAGRPRQACR